MNKIVVKPEYAHEVFGFNNSAKPLGEREDLHLLIMDAKQSGHKRVLDMFESIPTDEELIIIKEEAFKKKIRKPKPQAK